MKKLGKHSNGLKDLRRRVRTRRAGEVIIDGRRLVDDLFRWKVSLRELYLAPDVVDSEQGSRWRSAADLAWEVEASVLAGVAPTKNPQGVLAVVGEPQWAAWSGERGFSVFLGGVQDPGNVGAIIRSAAALGACAVLLAPGSADPFHPVAVRGSAGAVFRINVEREIDVGTAAERQRQVGGEVWATGKGGMGIDDWHPRAPLLLLVGAEGGGLRQSSEDLADGVVSIPLDREMDSLNVAVATGIFLQRLRSLVPSEL